MMDSIVLPTYRASFKVDGASADLIGTPVTATVPARAGGTSEATGVVVEIHDDHIVVEFIA